MCEVISLQHVSKIYRIRKIENFADYFKFYKPKTVIHAVNDISFTIRQGESIGLLGENGSGKSSLLKIMTGIITPTTGHVRIFNVSPAIKRKQIVKRIAVVFGQRSQLIPDISAKESYKLLQHIYSIDQEKYEKNLKQMTEILDLASFIDQPVRTLSLGQKMRAEFCATCLHDPEIIFLDEPTLGMDVFTKDIVLRFLKDINKEKQTTLVFITHAVNDIIDVCNRICFIKSGALILDKKTSEIQVADAVDIVVTFDKHIHPSICDLPLNFELRDNVLTLHDINASEVGNIIYMLFRYGKLSDIKILQNSFEKYFKQVYHEYKNA